MKFISYHSQTTVYISDEHFSVERTGDDSSIVLSVSGFSDSVSLFDFGTALNIADGDTENAELITRLIYEFVQRDISSGCNVISVDQIIKEISRLCAATMHFVNRHLFLTM